MRRSPTFARNILLDSAGKSKGIQYDNISGINSGPVSIAIWAKRLETQSANQQMLFVDQAAGDTAESGVRLTSLADSSIKFDISVAGGIAPEVVETNGAPLNTWVHFVCTWTGVVADAPIMYRNGISTGTADSGNGSRSSAPGSHCIGGRKATQNRGWGGLLAGIGRWQRILTASEADLLFRGMHPSELHPHDLVICPNFGTLENIAARRTSPLPNSIEHDGNVYDGPPQLTYRRKSRFALATPQHELGPIIEKPW